VTHTRFTIIVANVIKHVINYANNIKSSFINNVSRTITM
jgi:hypothetical protein